ncbi:MAG: hypothetical protein Q8L78_02120 [Coxiellaceae bacterium]|nr:hypothetical protein [Coxiellaceae bacterium]
MALRKILVVGATIFVAMGGSSLAIADSLYAHEPVTRPANIGYYFEGQVGYGMQDYASDVNWRSHSGVTSNNSGNVRGGFAGGIDAGYVLNHNIAVELGWLYLPVVNVAGVNASGSALPSVDLTSWVAYLAAKYMVKLPWVNNTNWFFKFGAAYRRAQVSTTAIVSGTSALPITNGSSNFVRPLFATGFSYTFADVWMAVFQYAHYMGESTAFPYNASATPPASGEMGVESADVFTVGMGYKFFL